MYTHLHLFDVPYNVIKQMYVMYMRKWLAHILQNRKATRSTQREFK